MTPNCDTIFRGRCLHSDFAQEVWLARRSFCEVASKRFLHGEGFSLVGTFSEYCVSIIRYIVSLFRNTNEGIINHWYLGVVIGERIVLLLTTLQLHGRIHGIMITGIVGQPEQLLDCKRGLLSQRWRRLVRSIAGGKVIGMMIPHWFHFGVNHFE